MTVRGPSGALERRLFPIPIPEETGQRRGPRRLLAQLARVGNDNLRLPMVIADWSGPADADVAMFPRSKTSPDRPRSDPFSFCVTASAMIGFGGSHERGHPNTLKPKPFDIFIVAEQFRYAGKFATLIPALAVANPGWFDVARDLNMPTAAMVCAAFSSELYFKCLIRIGRKSYAGVHDLSKLFSMIGRRNQANIKRYWNGHCEQVKSDVARTFEEDGLPAPKVDFDYVLSARKDAFRTMRYIYAKGIDTHKGWLADTVVEGARIAILAKYPEWENKRQISLLPKTTFQPTLPSL